MKIAISLPHGFHLCTIEVPIVYTIGQLECGTYQLECPHVAQPLKISKSEVTTR